MSFELPSDALRALPVKQPCLSPSGKAYMSDAVGIELPLDAASAFLVERLCFLFLHQARLICARLIRARLIHARLIRARLIRPMLRVLNSRWMP